MTPNQQPATKQNLVELESRLKTEIASAEQRTSDRLKAEIAAAEQRTANRLTETMRDTQREILRGLEAFASGNFARMHALESGQGDLVIRLAALEERALYLETRRPSQ